MIFLWYLALSDLLQAVWYSSSKKKNKEINTATNPPEWLNIKKTKKKSSVSEDVENWEASYTAGAGRYKLIEPLWKTTCYTIRLKNVFSMKQPFNF